MSFYLELLEEEYAIKEAQHEQSIKQAQDIEDSAPIMCACGMEYAQFCSSSNKREVCADGAEALELQ